ncbi:MAG: FtsK/SpoIIIE domain-containing protein [Actinomycetota bacterium]
MHWLCSVTTSDAPPRTSELRVSAPVGTTWGTAKQAIASHLAVSVSGPWRCGRHFIPDDATVGFPPLLHGAHLTVNHSLVKLPPQTAGTALSLYVIAGPDCGQVISISPGEHLIGRSGRCGITIADPALSHQHAVLSVAADAITVYDLGSSNGTDVAGSRVTNAGLTVSIGTRIRCGASILMLRTSEGKTTFTGSAPGNGTVLFKPRRTPHHAIPNEAIPPLPEPPSEPEPVRIPWATFIVPLLICVPMAWWLGQPGYLLFGLVGPLMTGFTVTADRRNRRRKISDVRVHHTREIADHSARINHHLAVELQARRSLVTDPATAWSQAMSWDVQLWNRSYDDPNVLLICLGEGSLNAAACITDNAGAEAKPPLRIEDAPVTVRLSETNPFGCVGNSERVRACARSIVGQLATTVSPRLLRMTVLGAPAPWEWSRWLPHDLDSHRAAEKVAAAIDNSRTLVVVDVLDFPHLHESDLASLYREAMSVTRPHLIWLCLDHTQLPPQCRERVHLTPHTAWLEQQNCDAGDDRGTIITRLNGTTMEWAQSLARSLAPLREMSDSDTDSIPDRVGLLPLVTDALDDSDVVSWLTQRWISPNRRLEVVVGVDERGPLTFHLTQDGPHMMVAGTTGAGKSEFLRTLVLSLAMTHRPDELSFILIDYKGGLAFRSCTALPHVTGVVTDLDPHLADRVLRSLRAEVTRRESILAEAGVLDVARYQKWAEEMPGRRSLSRLFVVIDEFRELVDQVPGFVDGLVKLAALGRSLGIHLVLATQRPAGVVTAHMRANINLRVALRVRDEADSRDVVDSPVAVTLPSTHPGRAVWRTGGGPVRSFQVASADGFIDAEVARICITDASTPLTTQVSPQPRGDIARMVRAAQLARRTLNIPATPPPWLPPLPSVLTATELLKIAESHAPGPQDAIPIGLLDDPDHGRQDVLSWSPTQDGHFLIAGQPQSGRSTLLRRIAGELIQRHEPAMMHLHMLRFDAGSSWQLPHAPHVGTVLTGSEPWVVARFLARLAAVATTPGQLDRPALTVLLVDSWEGMIQVLEPLDHGRAMEDLTTIMACGATAGICVVVTGGQRLASSRLRAHSGLCAILGPTSHADAAVLGLPFGSDRSDALPLTPPTGRGALLPSGQIFQVALPPESPRQHPNTHHALRIVQPGAPQVPYPDGLLRYQALPERVATTDLPPHQGLRIACGLGGDQATPMTVDFTELPLFAILGPRSSGRSTALRHLAAIFQSQGAPIHYMAASVHHVDSAKYWHSNDLVKAAASDEKCTGFVVIDDIEPFLDGQFHDALVTLIDEHPIQIVFSGSLGLSSDYRVFPRRLRHLQTGVVFNPRSPNDGDSLGIPLQATGPMSGPGRGVLVINGQQTAIQWAIPPSNA